MQLRQDNSHRGLAPSRGRRRAIVQLLILAAGAAMLLSACARKPDTPKIVLPQTPLPALQENWGVVNTLRLRLREGPSITTPALITLWKGYVLEVVKRSDKTESIGNYTDYWYYINYKGLRGWVYGPYMTMFDSRQRAEQASKELVH